MRPRAYMPPTHIFPFATSTQVPDGSVLGIDKSPKSVDVARKTLPKISFLCEDVLANPSCLNCNSWSAVFIDINGNRLLPAVKQAISIAQQLEPPPRLIVVVPMTWPKFQWLEKTPF